MVMSSIYRYVTQILLSPLSPLYKGVNDFVGTSADKEMT